MRRGAFHAPVRHCAEHLRQSNPEGKNTLALDCFVASAPRKDENIGQGQERLAQCHKASAAIPNIAAASTSLLS